MKPLLAATVLVLTAGCGGTTVASNPAPTATVTVTETVTETVTATPTPRAKPKPHGPPRVLPGSGTFKVGTDVAAGTYRNQGSENGETPCVAYVSRKPGDLQSYVRGTTLVGPGVIEIRNGEWVTTEYCLDFKRIG